MSAVTYRGESFHLQTTGRYYQSGDKLQPERLLHRRIWSDANGPIPDGYEIHHRDGDWRNSALDNLELIPRTEHRRRHMLERWDDPEQVKRFTEGMAKARIAAAQWHASPEGIEWHRKNGKAAWLDRAKATVQCVVCQKPFEAYFTTRAEHCSKACREKVNYRRHFTDRRKCAHCGGEFLANKYRSTAYCSRTCSNRDRL